MRPASADEQRSLSISVRRKSQSTVLGRLDCLNRFHVPALSG